MQPAAERGNLHRPREKGTAREEDRVRCLLRLRRARLLRACRRKCQLWDHRGHGCARRPCDVLLHPQRARRGRKPNRDHLGSGSPDHDSESGGARFLDPGGDDPRRPRLVRGRPRASERHHLLARPDRSVRRLSAAAGDHVSGRQGLRDRERAEPAALLAAPVQRDGRGRVRRLLRAAAGRVVRRAEGRRSLDHGDRPRSVTARERQPVREGQRLDLAGALPQGRRHRLPSQQAQQAVDGRAWFSPVSEPEQRSAAEGLSLAEGGDSESRPAQTGRLGCLQRHGAARVRGARPAGAGQCAEARPRRDGLAGRDPGLVAEPLYGQGERDPDRRGNAGAVLLRHRPLRQLRSRRAVAQLLPPRRRAGSRPVAERPTSARRLEAAVIRVGQECDRPDAGQVRADAARLVAHQHGQRRLGGVRLSRQLQTLE